jgi:hypothetical protein
MGDRMATTLVEATIGIVRRQISIAMTVAMPPTASPEGALAVACMLLHNPMGPDLSPEVAKQWRNNIDHLIVAAINMPTHRRHRAHHFGGSPGPSPALSRTLTGASLTTTDLRAELEHRRSGEDGRTSIERQHERHRNLDDNYGTMNATPAGHAVHTPTSLGSKGGCIALALHLQMVV